jgi:hypothetical protein
MTRKKFQVWHMPASSDKPGEGHFAIQGPVDFDHLATCDTLAKQIEAMLNAALLTSNVGSKKRWLTK